MYQSQKDSEVDGDTYSEGLRDTFAHTYIRMVTSQVHHNKDNRLITNAHFTKMFSLRSQNFKKKGRVRPYPSNMSDRRD